MLFLRYYADLDYGSIADALDIKPGTVGAHVEPGPCRDPAAAGGGATVTEVKELLEAQVPLRIEEQPDWTKTCFSA